MSRYSVQQYTLCRVEDDESLTPVSEHNDLFTAMKAGRHAIEVLDFDFAYALYTDDGIRLSTFGKGRIGYRQWARRNGYIHSVDDKYDHDIDELMGV